MFPISSSIGAGLLPNLVYIKFILIRSEKNLIRDLDDHLEDNRLVALNIAFEAAAMGESGRQLFEFACEALAYSNYAEGQAESGLKNPPEIGSGPVTTQFVLDTDDNPDFGQYCDRQIGQAIDNVLLQERKVENSLKETKADLDDSDPVCLTPIIASSKNQSD